MVNLQSYKISTKLVLLTLLFFVSFGLFGLLVFDRVNLIKINGPLYHQIVQSKDVVADVLPPPEYIVEAHLNSYQMIDALNKNASPDSIKSLVNKASQIRQDFNTRHEYWSQNLSDGSLKVKLVNDSYTPANDYFDLKDSDFIPAVQAGDRQKAQQILDQELTPRFDAHYSAIREVISLANTASQQTETQASATTTGTAVMLVSIGGIAVAISVIFGILIILSIIRPVKALQDAAVRLSEGDTDVVVPMHSKTEIGALADAFRKMIDYQKTMTGIAENIARGDLGQAIVPISARDRLGNAFAQMVYSLRDLVGQVAENARALGSASEQLTLTATQASQATSQIATTIQEVARGTAQQSESVTRTVTSVEQMSRIIGGVSKGTQNQTQAVTRAAEITDQIATAIQQVTSNAEASAKGSNQAAEVARGGAETVSATLAGMQNIQTKVALSAQKVTEMGARSEQIGVIVETIDDIASQTNLLALNAAIEAARAGEHGKGFAVVADEVRKLAERSSVATKEIGGLVKEIQRTVADAVTAMQAGSGEVERGVEQANQAGQALSEILRAAEEVNRQVSQIAVAAKHMGGLSDELVTATDTVSAVVEENLTATEGMQVRSNEVTQAIKNIARVSEENSASVEEVSSAAEEINAQVEEVTASTQSLAEMAEALKQTIARFKVSKEEANAIEVQEPKAGAFGLRSGNGNGHHQSLPQSRRLG